MTVSSCKKWRSLKGAFWRWASARALIVIMAFIALYLLASYQMTLWNILSFKITDLKRHTYFRNTPLNESYMTVLTTSLSALPPGLILADLTNLANMAKVRDVDCLAVFSGSESAIAEAINITKTRRKLYRSSYYINETADCNNFQSSRGYVMSSLTKMEEDFPIAYSMLVYKEPEMIERLLRAIYRPQNHYCIHVDKKSPDEFYKAIEGIAHCFPNVFLSSERIDIMWGRFTVLQPELICMAELWQYKKWKYFINLTGQEFPLKTNYELVKILTAYKGANDAHGTTEHGNHDRWALGGPTPHNINPVKGSVHVALSRDFVDYILHDSIAHDFLNWTARIRVPDETFFASLNYNPHLGIKGTYKGYLNGTMEAMTRYKVWNDVSRCASKRMVRTICILTTGDLPSLGYAAEMFANKFYLNEDQVVIDCLAEKLLNDTRDEYMGIKSFDTSIYENRELVLNRVL